MALREPTTAEKVYLIERAIEADYRRRTVEIVRELIRGDWDVLDVQELVEEILEGTPYELRGDIDYREEESE